MVIASLTFENVELKNPDFTGEKARRRMEERGYHSVMPAPSFSVEVADPELAKKLLNDGVALWLSKNPNNNAEPGTYNLNVRVDNRNNNVQIVLRYADGHACRMPEREWAALDKLFVKSIICTVNISRYPTPRGEAVNAFLTSMVVDIMDENEEANARAQRALDNDPTARLINSII